MQAKPKVHSARGSKEEKKRRAARLSSGGKIQSIAGGGKKTELRRFERGALSKKRGGEERYQSPKKYHRHS